ncbi:MAG: tetratricopeptide repeat protein [Nitrospira sp.]|nr:MAG: tetratricopeptide repeat protein [Nitrospira sp.]
MKTWKGKWPTIGIALAVALPVCFSHVVTAVAEIRTITATGEYRMGDNDTRADAKRLALLDAKRLALEQAGTYIESITQIKNFDLSKEEIRAYTAGIVEVVEQATRDTMEGTTHVIRVEVTAKIDTDVVARQIDALRRNENAKAELLNLRAENDRLKQQVEAKTGELVALRSKTEVGTVTRQRQQVLNRLEVSNLVARAWTSLLGTSQRREESTPEGRKAARNLITQALVIDPSHPGVRLALGALLNEEKKYKEAMQEFRTVLQMVSIYGLPAEDIALTRVLLGEALAGDGRPDEAILEYRAALRVLPESAGPHKRLGFLLLDRGDHASAIAEFRLALLKDPKGPDAHFGLGHALAEAGDTVEAIAMFQNGLNLNPDNLVAYALHHGLGDAYEKIGDHKASVAEYRNALRLRPDEYVLRMILALTLAITGDLDGAFEEFRIASTVKPESVQPHLNLGSILERRGDLKGAMAEYRTAARLEPSNAEAHHRLGESLQKRGDLAGAIAEYNTALRLKPDAQMHVSLGDALRTNGEVDKAIAEYRAAILLSPNIGGAHYGLGLAFKQNGLKREARYEFSEYLRLARASLKEYAEIYGLVDETSYFAQGLRKGSELLRKRVDEVQGILPELEE